MRIDQLRRHSFAVRYLTLSGGETFSKLCVMAAFSYMAHMLPPSEYGMVELALSVTMFFVMGVEGGMGLYGARIIAAHHERIPSLVPQVMVLRAIIAAPAFVLMLLAGARYRAEGFGLLGITAFAVWFTPLLTQWVFQGLRQMQWVAAGTALRNLTFVAVIFMLIRPGADIRHVGYAEVSGVAALALFNSAVLFGRLRVRLDLHDVMHGTKQVFKDAWFMGLGDFAWACMWYSPALVLGWLGLYGAEEIAWIAAPVRVVVALHTFVFLYFFNLLPNLAVELTKGVAPWRSMILRSMRASTWPAILLAAGGAITAPITVPLVFGHAYVSAVLPFQIVIWVIPVTWFSGHFRFSLIAAGHQRREFGVSVATAIVTVIGAVVLGSQWGSVGSAAALLAGGIVNAILAVVVSHHTLGAVPLGTALVPDVRTWLNPRDSL